MSDGNEKSGKGKSSRKGNNKGDSLSRRKFIGGAIAGVGAMGASAAGAPKARKNKADAPVWSGDLRNVPQPRAKIPTTAKPNGLNLIVIIADTFRQDHLGCYGSTRVKTPNLDALAEKSVVFTDATAEGLPTIPCRRVYHTGKSVLPEAKWKPLEPNDITLAEVLGKHGVKTGLIIDTYHHFKENYNFHRNFDTWQWIRGQETDKYKSGPREKFDTRKHIPAHMWNENYNRNLQQFMMNTQDRQSEEDYFCAQSCSAAVDWLGQNRGGDPFMLWIDMFDPHEPWDAPPRFQKMYRDKYPLERYLFGYGVRNSDIRPEDYPVLQDLYAAEVTFSDYCIGRLIKAVEDQGLMDNTVIVFSTDHGTHLGEEGCVQKRAELLNGCVTSIPLIIKHPDSKFAGKRVDGLVGAVDFMPTFLDLMGIDDYKNVDGQSMWKLVTGQAESINENVFTVFGKFGSIHNKQWHYFQHIVGEDRGKGPALYKLDDDPKMAKNVIKQHPEVADKMRTQLQTHLGIEIPQVQV